MPNDPVYKEHYFFELSRRDALNGGLSFPVGLVTLLAGAILVMWKQVTWPITGLSAVLASLLLLGAFCLMVAIWYLVKTYWRYTYKHMPLAGDLLAYESQLFDYYIKNGNPDAQAKQLATDKFASDLNAVYAKNCQINSLNNDSKSFNLFMANSFIVAAIGLAIAATPVFVIVSYKSPQPPPQRVEITNLKEISVPDNDQQENERQPARQEQEPEPVMPTMPPSRDVKEHVDPLKQG